MRTKQEALLALDVVANLAAAYGVASAEILDHVLGVRWRTIAEREYSEAVTWGQMILLRDEWLRARKK
jgi:hypothetical protein